MSDVVFELADGVRREGLFRTEDGARARAQEILDGWIKLYKESTDINPADAEELTAPGGRLEWDDEQHYLGGPGWPGKKVPVGDPVPTAHYSETGYFTIHRRTVHP